MTTSDGHVVGVTKIVDHGPDNARWNLVIMGDGYQTGQLTQYHNDVQSFVTTLFATAPFGDLQPAINVHRVDVSSTDAGADDPTACGGSGATARTYFDASFCNGGIQRLLEVNNTTALTVAANQVPQFHMAMVLVNSSVYGGSGGSVATFSLAAGANEIGLHEMGHTAFGFADEYEYWAGCGVDTDRNQHPATEPAEPNVTINANRATNKWRDLVAASTAMPTTANADCSKCDPQANPVSASTVGAFEGAHYYHCGAYRPQYTCRMRALNNPFCAVCQRVIRQKLTPFLPQVPLAVADPAPYAFVAESKGVVEQHNLFRTSDGHIHALWFNFATGWHHEDRTAMIPGVPPAVSDPVPYAFVAESKGVVEQHNLFRTGDGHIHALWFNFATGWHHEDRTAMIPGVPPAVGNPAPYAFVAESKGVVEQHNLFRTSDGHIHALWFNFATGWHHEDRTAMIPGVPPAVSDPVPYAFVAESKGVVEQHNLFRTGDGHIHALWFNFATGWHHEDRTAMIPGVPPAVGNPAPYAFVAESKGVVEQHNLFRTSDGHIHALWFNFATGWHHEDRTAMIPGVPPAVGNPAPYAFVAESKGVVEQHNLFRTGDGHIHALWFNFATGWHHEDRTAMIPGVPPAVGNPAPYAFVAESKGVVEQHNLFRTSDGHIHALWFNFATGWHHEDRTAMIH